MSNSSVFTDVPAGHLAAVVTSLEMRQRPEGATVIDAARASLRRIETPALEWYRAIFRAVGADWLWTSRLRLNDAELAAIIDDPKVEIYALVDDGREIGLLELDFRSPGECELAFFGVTADAIGTGVAHQMMRFAIARAWSKDIERFWVHTCTLDHPRAVSFYVRSGFVPIKREIEILPDPRLSGVLPRLAAPQTPVL